MIVCYAGNLFHVMFHQVGVVLFKGKAFDVLDRRLLKQNKFKDISNNKLVLQLRAVGNWSLDLGCISCILVKL